MSGGLQLMRPRFTYNLRRIDLKDCLPKFDLTKTVATPTAPCWDGKTRTLFLNLTF
jgi:hypothetical protein